MKNFIQGTNKIRIILWVFISAYILYFSHFTILRYQTLHSYYLDLGIMHQAVFNTYRAISDFDFSRILEITEPFGVSAVKRMAIHNDVILAPLSLFYFIYASPATLLVIQALILGVGTWFVFKITQTVFIKTNFRDILALLFAVSYLLYVPLQRANIFDFHPVTLSTTFLLAMFYFFLKKKYFWSIVFVILSLLTKEQVGLTIAFFAAYTLFAVPKGLRNLKFSLWTLALSLTWFLASIFVIIPYFREGSEHFALEYFTYLSSFSEIFSRLFSFETWDYLFKILGPVGFLSLLSPVQFLIAAPELGINLLSANANLRNVYFHYSSVITPFVFISAIYGARLVVTKLKAPLSLFLWLFVFSLAFAYSKGPLPYSRASESKPFKSPLPEAKIARVWAEKLKDENLKVTTSGKLAPLFTSRRYFYNFTRFYPEADYVVILADEVYNYWIGESTIPVYEALKQDSRFNLIYKQNNFEVYKKL